MSYNSVNALYPACLVGKEIGRCPYGVGVIDVTIQHNQV